MAAPAAAPSLSVVVPAYNEEAALTSAITFMAAEMATLGGPGEIVIVDDGSTDRTPELADELTRLLPGVRAVHHAVNQGWGQAVRTGIANCKHEFLVLSPVDSPLGRTDMAAFLAAAPGADIVAGYRTRRAGYPAWLAVGSRCYHRLVSAMFGLSVRDVNWVHLYRKTSIESLPLRLSGVAFPAEVLARATRRGYRIVEVHCEMKARTTGQSTVTRPRVIVQALRDVTGLWLEFRRGARRGGGRAR
jgi:glycosyltransferase involved in cell wall biosynthesis